MWIVAFVSFSVSIFLLKYMTISNQKKKYYQAEDKNLKIFKVKE